MTTVFRPEQLYQTMSALIADLAKSTRMVPPEGEEHFWRRMYARNLFAYFEGHTSMLRLIGTALICEKTDSPIPITKLALLQDTHFHIKKNGTLQEEQQRQSTVNYMAFTLRTVAEVMGEEEGDINRRFGDNGWNDFQKAIKIRDRLTHPKVHTDLEISEEEYDQLLRAYDWYEKFAGPLIRSLPSDPQPNQVALETDDNGLHFRLLD